MANPEATPDTFQSTAAWLLDNRRSTTGFTGSGLNESGHILTSVNYTGGYEYDGRGHLREESVTAVQTSNTASANRSYNNVQNFDFDADKLGVRTVATDDVSQTIDQSSSDWEQRWSVPDGYLDAFARMQKEVLRDAVTPPNTATGTARDTGEIRLTLSELSTGDSYPLSNVAFNPDEVDASGNSNWSAPLDLEPGDYELRVEAIHKSGAAKVSDTSRFSVMEPTTDVIDSDYDDQGFTTQRTFGDGRIQSLTWDAGGRLLEVIEVDPATGDGYQWEAAYCPMGRRLYTSYTEINANVPASTSDETRSYYDPSVRFMEIAVSLNGSKSWKIYGPDSNGRYGGLHGIGGCVAVYVESEAKYYPLIHDMLGNIVAHIDEDVAGDQIDYNEVIVSGYGTADGYEAKTWGDNPSATQTNKLWVASVWHGYRVDPTGYICMGARYYEQQSGRFLSPDPLGHEASWDLYNYAGGDPINFFDPTGFARVSGVDATGKDPWMNDWLIRSEELAASDSVGDRFKAMGYGLAGVARGLPGMLSYTFNSANLEMANVRNDINQQIDSGEMNPAVGAMARVGLSTGDFALGTTSLIMAPHETVPQIPQAAASLPGHFYDTSAEFWDDPSLSGFYDNVENAGSLLLLTRATLSKNPAATSSSTRQISNVNTISAAEANAPFVSKGWSPPYASGTNVKQFTAASDLDFVRVHTSSNPTGAFLTRAKEISQPSHRLS